MVWFTALVLSVLLQADAATIVCTVTVSGAPLSGAEVVINGQTAKTDREGRAQIPVAAGLAQLTVVKDGFAPVTTLVTVAAGQEQAVFVELQPVPTIEEQVTVSANRHAPRRSADARRSAER